MAKYKRHPNNGGGLIHVARCPIGDGDTCEPGIGVHSRCCKCEINPPPGPICDPVDDRVFRTEFWTSGTDGWTAVWPGTGLSVRQGVMNMFASNVFGRASVTAPEDPNYQYHAAEVKYHTYWATGAYGDRTVFNFGGGVRVTFEEPDHYYTFWTPDGASYSFSNQAADGDIISVLLLPTGTDTYQCKFVLNGETLFDSDVTAVPNLSLGPTFIIEGNAESGGTFVLAIDYWRAWSCYRIEYCPVYQYCEFWYAGSLLYKHDFAATGELDGWTSTDTDYEWLAVSYPPGYCEYGNGLNIKFLVETAANASIKKSISGFDQDLNQIWVSPRLTSANFGVNSRHGLRFQLGIRTVELYLPYVAGQVHYKITGGPEGTLEGQSETASFQYWPTDDPRRAPGQMCLGEDIFDNIAESIPETIEFEFFMEMTDPIFAGWQQVVTCAICVDDGRAAQLFGFGFRVYVLKWLRNVGTP